MNTSTPLGFLEPVGCVGYGRPAGVEPARLKGLSGIINPMPDVISFVWAGSIEVCSQPPYFCASDLKSGRATR